MRFYAQPWDQNSNVALQGKPSFLVGEDVLSPIPPFSDTPDKLNWVLANTNFDTTGYDNQFFTFWVVCWIQNADGALESEAVGHGLKSIPGPPGLFPAGANGGIFEQYWFLEAVLLCGAAKSSSRLRSNCN